jgi:hypothetical protein
MKMANSNPFLCILFRFISYISTSNLTGEFVTRASASAWFVAWIWQKQHLKRGVEDEWLKPQICNILRNRALFYCAYEPFNWFHLYAFTRWVSKASRSQFHRLRVLHHLLHGTARNVRRTGRSVNGNRPKLTPYRSETQFITFGATP